MNVLDYIIIGALVLSVIIGLVKGFVDILLGIVGLFGVTIGTFYLYKTPLAWLSGIDNQIVAFLVAIIGTAIVLGVVYIIISRLIIKLMRKVKVLKVIDTILGGLLGAAFVYFIFAVFVGAVSYQFPADSILSNLNNIGTDFLAQSTIATKLYANNPIGDWLLSLLA
jgi:uncharacterized membrane protein required for colicin V production